jgi:hypothetical protein
LNALVHDGFHAIPEMEDRFHPLAAAEQRLFFGGF